MLPMACRPNDVCGRLHLTSVKHHSLCLFLLNYSWPRCVRVTSPSSLWCSSVFPAVCLIRMALSGMSGQWAPGSFKCLRSGFTWTCVAKFSLGMEMVQKSETVSLQLAKAVFPSTRHENNLLKVRQVEIKWGKVSICEVVRSKLIKARTLRVSWGRGETTCQVS